MLAGDQVRNPGLINYQQIKSLTQTVERGEVEEHLLIWILHLGLDRPPPPYYDYDYEERYGDRYGPYDREYDGPPSRRPPPGGPYGRYDTPFNRPYGGNGLDDRPIPLPGLGLSHPPTPYGGGGGGSHVGLGVGVHSGPPRPPITRCEESDNFKQIAARHKMRRHFVRRALIVPSLIQCERECIESRDFVCRSFNYRWVGHLVADTRYKIHDSKFACTNFNLQRLGCLQLRGQR